MSRDEWADANPNPMLGGPKTTSEGTEPMGTDNTTGHTVAMVSLTTGNPEDLDGIVTASTWLIGNAATGEAFRAVMTKRYGEPIQSMQPAGNAGMDEGLIIFGEGEPNA